MLKTRLLPVTLALFCLHPGLALFAQDKSSIRPPMPAQRDPFLKERGAPVSAPSVSENFVAMTAIFETYVLSQEDAVTLLSSAPDATARYHQVTQWVAAGRARLETVAASAAKSGRRVLVESADMVQIANQFLAPQRREEAAIPAAFLQVSYGDRLEFQALLGADARTCNLNFSLVSNRLRGFRGFRAAAGAPPQPGSDYEKSEILTSVAVRTGEPVLLGTLSRPAGSDNGETAVAFARILVNQERPEEVAPANGPVAYAEHLISIYSLERAAAHDLLIAGARPGGAFAAVRALVEKKQARLERVMSLASQSEMRAKSDEGFISNQPGGGTPAVAAAEVPRSNEEPSKTRVAYVPALSGKNFGLSLELDSVAGPADALLKGVPLLVDVSTILSWRADGGLFKPGAGVPEGFPETGVQESRKIENALSCYAGVQTFLGTLNPPRETGVNERKDSGRVWLAFIRVTPVKP